MLALDVRAAGCDVLTAAGRKFLCGPRGTGFAYLSERFLATAQPRFTDLGRATVDVRGVVTRGLGDARCFEYAERNNAAIVGLNQAIKERLSSAYGAESERYRELFRRLAQIPGVNLIAPGTHHQGILAFTHERCSATEVVSYLRARGINGWPGYASHTPYFMLAQGHERFVRVSVNARNTAQEVDELIALLSEL